MDRRRFLIIGGAATALASEAFAAPEERAVPATAVFSKLQDYYSLPASQRSRFRVFYVIAAKPGPLPPVMLQSGAARRVFSMSSSGRVLDPPTAAELASDAKVIVPGGGQKFSSRIELEPILAAGPEYAVADASAAVSQANAAISKFAGPLALVLPKLKGVRFLAPETAAGATVSAAGARSALPYRNGAFEFLLAKGKPGDRIVFTAAPASVEFL